MALVPYYDLDGVVIYHGDSRDIFPSIQGYDLILTDPPYGIGYLASNPSVAKHLGVMPAPIQNDDIELDLGFLLMADCDMVVFGANNFPNRLPFGGRWVCWDKRVNENADRMLGSPFELAWTNKKSGYDRMIRLMHGGVVNADGANIPRVHPTQKPIKLFMEIIKLYPDSKNLIDPFMGSGSVLIAAKRMGMKSIGIEIEERYCEAAARRLSQMELPFDAN